MMKNENFFKFSVPPEELKKIGRKEIAEGTEEYWAKESVDERPEKEGEAIPEELMDTQEFAQKNPEMINDVYEWYSKAMSRKERAPLEKERFINHFFDSGSSDPTFMFGDLMRGYLLGFFKHKIFIPTHFAPKSIRKGYELVKELGASAKIPVVMAITEDLAETIKEIPSWKLTDLSFLAYFHNDIYKKTIVFNSYPDIEKLLPALLEEYSKEQEEMQEVEEDEY